MTAGALPTPTRPRLLRALPWIVWPTLVGLCYAVMIFADSNDLRGQATTGLSLGMLVVVMLLEPWFPLDPEQGIRDDPLIAQDVGHFLLNGLGQAFSSSGLLLIPIALAGFAGDGLWPHQWPWYLQCALALIAADFLGYWEHRLAHQVPALWAIHVLHHDIERLHIFKGTRQHFLTSVVRALLISAPLLLLGAPIALLFWYQTLAITQASIVHANLTTVLPNWLHSVVVTPQVHRIHHGRARTLSDTNLSTVFTIWDRLFGTWTDPVGLAPVEIEGVESGGVPAGFLRQIAHPLTVWMGRPPV